MSGACSGIGARNEMMKGIKMSMLGVSLQHGHFYVRTILRFLRRRRYWFRVYRGDRGLRHHH